MIKLIPLGDRILLKRRKVGEKIGSLYVSDGMKDSPTDLAEVISVADNTFADKEIINNAQAIIESLTKKASEGDSEAMIALLRLNEYLKIKAIKPGDVVMLGKYVGTDFMDNNLKQEMTLANGSDIIAVMVDR